MKIAVRTTPSTSQKRTAEPSWSLIRLVNPTGTTKKSPTARASESAKVGPPVDPADRLLVLVHLRVRGEREGPEADLQRLGEGDDAAEHGHPQDPVPLRPRDHRLGGDLDLALGGADGGGPGRDAAHHHPLEDRLTAD